ncbi:unnamed protein product, partial [Rotaria sordida]
KDTNDEDYSMTAISSIQLPTPQNHHHPKKDTINNTNTFISLKQDNMNQAKECDTITPITIQRQPSKKYRQQKLSSIDGEILTKVDDDNRFVL